MKTLSQKRDRQFWITAGFELEDVHVHAQPVREHHRVHVSFWIEGATWSLPRRYVGRLLSKTNLPLPKHGTDQIVRVVVNLEMGAYKRDFLEQKVLA